MMPQSEGSFAIRLNSTRLHDYVGVTQPITGGLTRLVSTVSASEHGKSNVECIFDSSTDVFGGLRLTWVVCTSEPDCRT